MLPEARNSNRLASVKVINLHVNVPFNIKDQIFNLKIKDASNKFSAIVIVPLLDYVQFRNVYCPEIPK